MKRTIFSLIFLLSILATQQVWSQPNIWTPFQSVPKPALAFWNLTGSSITITMNPIGVVFDDDLVYRVNNDIQGTKSATIADGSRLGVWRQSETIATADDGYKFGTEGRVGCGKYEIQISGVGVSPITFDLDLTDAYWAEPNAAITRIGFKIQVVNGGLVGDVNLLKKDGTSRQDSWSYPAANGSHFWYWQFSRFEVDNSLPPYPYTRGRTGYPASTKSTKFTFDSEVPNGELPIGINTASLDVHVHVRDANFSIPSGKSMIIRSDDDTYLEDPVWETRLKFESGYARSLTVNGSLSTDFWTGLVVFTTDAASPQKGNWAGITVGTSGVYDSKGSEIEYATDGLTVTSAQNNPSTIRYAYIHDCSGNGAVFSTPYSVEVLGLHTQDCNGDGILARNSGELNGPIEFRLCTSEDNNQWGIEIEDSHSYIDHTNIGYNGASSEGYGGLYVHLAQAEQAPGSTWTTLRRSHVYNNTEWGIRTTRANLRGYIPGGPNIWDTPALDGLNCIEQNARNLYSSADSRWEFGKPYYDQFSTPHHVGGVNMITNPTYHQFWFNNGYDISLTNNYWDPIPDQFNSYYDFTGTVDVSAQLSVPPDNTPCSPESGKAVANIFEVWRHGPGVNRSPSMQVSSEAPVAPRIIHWAYPNPFNPTTTIAFLLPASTLTRVTVIDVLGRTIATLHDGMLGAGEHRLSFDAGTQPSGLYFYTITAGEAHVSGRLMLAK